MRKLIVTLVALGALIGPMASFAQADPTVCRLMEKLGYTWVRECE